MMRKSSAGNNLMVLEAAIFLLIVLVFSVYVVSASGGFSCSITASGSCGGGNTSVIYLENSTGGYWNAHAQNVSDGTYDYVICCNSSSSLSYACDEGVFLKLQGAYQFDKCMNITITNAGSSTLTNFPVYINLTHDNDMQPDFKDIRFYSESCNNGGTSLDYDIENYTTNDRAHVWVRIPSLPSSGKNISIYYKNNTAVSSGENPTGVWDSNYVGVWHMTEVNATDSTSNKNNGTESGGVTYTGSGRVDGADEFDGDDDVVQILHDASLDLDSTNFTIVLWFITNIQPPAADAALITKRDTYGTQDWRIFMESTTNGELNMFLGEGGGDWNLVLENLNHIPPANEWHHIAITRIVGSPDDTYELFGNGVSKGTDTSNTTWTSSDSIFIGGEVGCCRLNGTIDEVRISNTKRSPDWINQSYLIVVNQSDYVSFDSEEAGPGVLKGSHVQRGDYSGPGIVYGVDTCLTADPGYFNCTYVDDSCPGDRECFASMGGSNSSDNDTNAHIGPCGEYRRKICCNLGNTPPTHTTPGIVSTSGNNLTTDNITCYNQSTYDADGDSVTNIYNWYKDGKSIAVLNMPFDTNTVSTAGGAVKDYSGYDNDGTISDIEAWNDRSGCTRGGCYSFDGSDDLINVTNKGLRSSVGSIELWLSSNSAGNDNKNYTIISTATEISDNDTELVGLWHFNNDSAYGENDTHVYDFSGNGNGGTVVNAEWNKTGKLSGGFGFDANGEFINISQNSINGDKGTIMFWFKPSYEYDDGDGHFLVARFSDYGSNDFWIDKWTGPSNHMNFEIVWNGSTGSRYTNRISGTDLANYWTQNKWMHITCTWDKNLASNTMNTYINTIRPPQSSPSGPWTNIWLPPTNIYVGNDGEYNNVYPADGVIDELAIFNRTLSLAEIREHYLGGLSLHKDSDNNLRFHIGNVTLNTSIAGWAANEWHHIVGVYDGSAELYVDGVLNDSVSVFTPARNIYNNTFIGNDEYNGTGFNGSIDEVKIYNHSLSAEQIYQLYLEGKNNYTNSTVTSSETSYGEDWKCSVTPNDAKDDGITLNSSVLTIENTPPDKVVLSSPADGSHVTNRTPEFQWEVPNDPDGDTLNYTINITCFPGCSDDNRYVEDLGSNTYTPTQELQYFGDDNHYYNWSVRAGDGYEYGQWSDVWNLTIDTNVSILLINNTVDFGEERFVEYTDNTTDNDPYPFSLRNIGNCMIDVNISSSDLLWDSASQPSDYFNYSVDWLAGEEGAFNWSGSQTSPANIPQVDQNVTFIDYLNYTSGNSSAEIDLYIEVPSEEPPGTKSSTIMFTGEYHV